MAKNKPISDLEIAAAAAKQTENEVADLTAQVSAAEDEHARTLRGFDPHHPGNFQLVVAFNRSGPSAAQQEAADAFLVETLTPLRQRLKDAKAAHQRAREDWAALDAVDRAARPDERDQQDIDALVKARAALKAEDEHEAQVRQQLEDVLSLPKRRQDVQDRNDQQVAHAVANKLPLPALEPLPTVPEGHTTPALKAALQAARQRREEAYQRVRRWESQVQTNRRRRDRAAATEAATKVYQGLVDGGVDLKLFVDILKEMHSKRINNVVMEAAA